MDYMSYYESPIGKIMITSDEKYITGLWFTSSRFIDSYKEENYVFNDTLEVIKTTKDWLDKYFKGEKVDYHDIPLSLVGSDFCLEVWDILKEIPYGKTITYGEIANKIAKTRGITKMSSQAVGYAVGHNPISIIIPCHRVVGKKGNLTGYGGGIDKKIALLEIEKIDMSKYYIPKKGNAL